MLRHTKSRLIRTSGSWDNAFTRSGKDQNGCHFYEHHWTVTKTFPFSGQEGVCLHTKSRVIRILGSWNNAFIKSRKIQNGRHFLWTMTKTNPFRGRAGKYQKLRVIRTTGSWDHAFTNLEKLKMVAFLWKSLHRDENLFIYRPGKSVPTHKITSHSNQRFMR